MEVEAATQVKTESIHTIAEKLSMVKLTWMTEKRGSPGKDSWVKAAIPPVDNYSTGLMADMVGEMAPYRHISRIGCRN